MALCGLKSQNTIKNKSVLLLYPACLKGEVEPIANEIREKTAEYIPLSWWTADKREVAEAGGAYAWAKGKMRETTKIIMFNDKKVNDLLELAKQGNQEYEDGVMDLAFLTMISVDLPKFKDWGLDLLVIDFNYSGKEIQQYPSKGITGVCQPVTVETSNYFAFPGEKEKFFQKLESEENNTN